MVKDTLTGNEGEWNGGVRDIIQMHKSWADVINDSSIEDTIKNHINWAKECFAAKPKPNYTKDLKLNEFQNQVCERLDKQNNRQFLWVCDKMGGRGKSTLTNYLIDNKNAFFCNNGKISDVSYAYNNEEYVVFDLPRTTIDSDGKDWTPYRLIEMMKDGRLFSSKYQSCMKRFKSPKIVVFANFMPDQKTMSSDRWDILDCDCDSELPPSSLTLNENSKKKNKKKKKNNVSHKNVKELSLSELKKRSKKKYDSIFCCGSASVSYTKS